MYRTETLTETLPLAELTRRFRNPEKFIAYCRECGRYGHCWACPPYEFDPSEVLAGYTVAWIAGIRIIPDEALRNRLATPEEATEAGREMLARVRAAIDPQLLAIERKHPGSRAFFAGTCFACPEGACTGTRVFRAATRTGCGLRSKRSASTSAPSARNCFTTN